VTRILLGWELGLNLGHLTRLLPIAQHFRAQGHTVIVAARDLQSATTVLGPAGISFVQAPHLPRGIPLTHRPAGYADILLSQGWSDRAALWGLIQGWVNLLQMFRPHRLILDYSPTLSLASRIAQIPTTLVGNGFELPPATNPLPPFPGFSWASAERATQSEQIAVTNANSVLSAYGASPLEGLCQLFESTAGASPHPECLLATAPELDHYGPRPTARYVGPLLGAVRAARVDWPRGSGPRIFACLRPDTRHVGAILRALAMSTDCRVICVAPGFTRELLQPHIRQHIIFTTRPVDLQPLLDADLCVTYGAEGTMLTFLTAGVPQLIAPWHVETYMAAARIEAAGLGAAIPDAASDEWIAQAVRRLVEDQAMRDRVREFGGRLSRYSGEPFLSVGELAA
jgi:UDP:flavonoid glycosyltransferase YjiC (YdhE family)